jgi:hypothetical protein
VSKFISMALVKANAQNELGDLISDPYVECNRFRVINKSNWFLMFLYFCSEDFAGMAGLCSYLWPL